MKARKDLSLPKTISARSDGEVHLAADPPLSAGEPTRQGVNTPDDAMVRHGELHDEVERLLIAAERTRINDLFRSGKLKDESRRRIERELDLRENHLSNQRSQA